MSVSPSQTRLSPVILLALVLALLCLPAQGQDRGLLPSDDDLLLTGVAFGQGTFVAIGKSLALMTSQDGTNWVRKAAKIIHPVFALNYSSETYSAGGDSVTFVYPEKGHAPTNLPALNLQLRAVGFGAGTFVLVGDWGSILTSQMADTWTVRRSGALVHLTGVCWGNNRFIAVGEEGTLLASTDGTAWAPRESKTKKKLRSVAYGNGRFVAVGNDSTILTSPDGDNWTSQNVDWLEPLTSVAFGDNRFMFMTPAGIGLAAVSEDAQAWRAIAHPGGNKLQLTYAGSYFFCTVGSMRPKVFRQNARWEPEFPQASRDTLPRGAQLLSVAYGKGVYVAVGSRIETSTDGLHWQCQQTPGSKLLWGNLWKDGLFTPGFPLKPPQSPRQAHASWPLTSTNGITWTRRLPDPFGPISGNVQGNISIYTSLNQGVQAAALTSEDGVVWTRLQPTRPLCPQPAATVPSKPVEPLPANPEVLVHLNGKSYPLHLPPGAGPLCYLQASTNLVHWVELAVLTNTAGQLNFVDPDASKYPMRFYRLMVP